MIPRSNLLSNSATLRDSVPSTVSFGPPPSSVTDVSWPLPCRAGERGRKVRRRGGELYNFTIPCETKTFFPKPFGKNTDFCSENISGSVTQGVSMSEQTSIVSVSFLQKKRVGARVSLAPKSNMLSLRHPVCSIHTSRPEVVTKEHFYMTSGMKRRQPH